MRASAGFGFFLLFLAGIALVSFMSMSKRANTVPTVEQLSASAWRLTNIGEMKIDNDSEMFVQFAADGRLTGHGGCNNFFSRYRLEENKIHVDPISVTRKSCASDVMSLELSLIESLQLATTINGVGRRMAMRNDQGQASLRFVAIDREADQ
ncbi:MAG: META domain-containing protein [Burkholderiales bacterium]|nr:META domain-containing protein [Burkholderiales bacterium]